MNKNIRDLVLEAMTTDDSFNEGNSRNIVKLYGLSTISEQEFIDKIFINLCGFSLKSFIQSVSNSESVTMPTLNSNETYSIQELNV